jgi:hypothetical protein
VALAEAGLAEEQRLQAHEISAETATRQASASSAGYPNASDGAAVATPSALFAAGTKAVPWVFSEECSTRYETEKPLVSFFAFLAARFSLNVRAGFFLASRLL